MKILLLTLSLVSMIVLTGCEVETSNTLNTENTIKEKTVEEIYQENIKKEPVKVDLIKVTEGEVKDVSGNGITWWYVGFHLEVTNKTEDTIMLEPTAFEFCTEDEQNCWTTTSNNVVRGPVRLQPNQTHEVTVYNIVVIVEQITKIYVTFNDTEYLIIKDLNYKSASQTYTHTMYDSIW